MPKYRKAVFIAVYRINKKTIDYLVLKRKLHWSGWEFPKGGVERGESLAQAVKRECFEETGCSPLKIKKLNIKGRYKYSKPLDDRAGFIGQSYSLFAAQIKCNKIKLDKKEHSSYKWLKFKDAIKVLTWPNQQVSLETVNRF